MAVADATKPSVRVHVHGRRFYVRYWDDGAHDISTGIIADIPEPKGKKRDPDWWKQSALANEIEPFVTNAQSLSEAAKRKRQRDRQTKKRNEYLKLYAEPFPGLPAAPTTLESILDVYTYELELKRKRGKLAEGTKDRRRNALKLLRRFDHNYTYDAIDNRWLTRFRDWAEGEFEGSTLTGYLSDIRAIVQFGIDEKYLAGDKNKFLDINFSQIVKPARKTPWNDEERLYRFLYAENKPLFDQVVFQRLTGFRVTWVCDLLVSEIDLRQGIITSLNRKAGRIEDFPIIKPLLWLLKQRTSASEGFAFKFRNRSAVYANLGRACEYSGVSAIGTHQLKKNYISEWRRYTGDPDAIAFLSHHATKGMTRTSRVHYVDPEEIMDIARDTLERAQTKRWMEFFASLKKVKPSGKVYLWSNKKGHWNERKNNNQLGPGRKVQQRDSL